MLCLFVVETNNKTKSDEIYINELTKHRYEIRGTKIDFIYMNGVSNYDKKVMKLIPK